MREKLIKAILEKPSMPQNNVEFNEALKRLADNDLIAFAANIGIDTDAIIHSEVLSS